MLQQKITPDIRIERQSKIEFEFERIFYSTFKVSFIVRHAKVSETNVVKKCLEPNHEHHKTHAA